MTVRVVMIPGAAERVDPMPLLEELGDDVVEVGRAIAPKETGAFAASIHREEGRAETVYVVADAVHPGVEADDASYSAFVELGTSDTEAHHTLKNATYRYRSP